MKRLIFLFVMMIACATQMSAQERCTRCENGKIPDRCSFCNDGWRECNLCCGKKYIKCTVCLGAKRLTCYNCNGRGYWVDKDGDKRECNRCGGEGTPICERCSGDGEIMCPSCSGAGGEKCRQCDGSGVKYWRCPECNGTGYKD